MKKLLTFTTILVFILTGCNEKTYTIDEFSANKELRNEYNKKCKNGEIDTESLNCQNVFKASIHTKVDNANWD